MPRGMGEEQGRDVYLGGMLMHGCGGFAFHVSSVLFLVSQVTKDGHLFRTFTCGRQDGKKNFELCACMLFVAHLCCILCAHWDLFRVLCADIDFGHFLGNFKSKFGINRERAAFVFTPEMAYVMGGNAYRKSSQFKKFLDYCSRAFKILRVHANLLESLFGLMVAAGMPELIKETDIYYMRDKLYLHEKEAKAEKQLHVEIENSLDSKYRRFDNFVRAQTDGHTRRYDAPGERVSQCTHMCDLWVLCLFFV